MPVQRPKKPLPEPVQHGFLVCAKFVQPGLRFRFGEFLLQAAVGRDVLMENPDETGILRYGNARKFRNDLNENIRFFHGEVTASYHNGRQITMSATDQSLSSASRAK